MHAWAVAWMLCAAGPAAAQIAPVAEYGAHAMTTDNASLYGWAGSRSANSAQKVVMDFCREWTGKECRLLGVFKNTCQGFASDEKNTPYRGVDNDPRKAMREAMAACFHASGEAQQCRLRKLPLCVGKDYVDSTFSARKKWEPANYDEQLRIWTEEAKRGFR